MHVSSNSEFLPEVLWSLAEGFRAVVPADSVKHDLKSALELCYPISVHYLTPLTTLKLERWLAKRGRYADFGEPVRDLYGCVISLGGIGFIFLEETLSPAEQRFTLAHEFAHFLREYHMPRQRALSMFGEEIRDVLDGERRPTTSERLEAVLRRTSLHLFRHLMLRDPERKLLETGTHQAEVEADLLALELLAPYQRLLAAIPVHARTQQAFFDALIKHYDLPASISRRYATQLAAHFAPRPSVRDWLGLGHSDIAEQEDRSSDE